MVNKKTFLYFILPALAAFIIIILVPTLMGFHSSFKDWKGGSSASAKYNGFENYSNAFHSDAFKKALWYTAIYAILSLVLVNVIGFGLAKLLTISFRGVTFFRAGFYLPNLIGGLVLGFIWQFIFGHVFQAMGFQDLLTSRWKSMLGFVVVTSWQFSGYVMVIYIAALQNVPKDLIEAAKINGAKTFKVFRTVTLPQIMPAITVAVFIVLTNSFKQFDVNLSLTNGGNDTTMVALDIYRTAYGNASDLGLAQAKAIIFTVIISSIALTQVVLSKRMEIEA